VVQALKMYANILGGDAKASALETADYFNHMHSAYHLCLLNTSTKLDHPSKLDSVQDLHRYYKAWITALEGEAKPILASKGFKESIAYQTYVPLEIVHHARPSAHLSPLPGSPPRQLQQRPLYALHLPGHAEGVAFPLSRLVPHPECLQYERTREQVWPGTDSASGPRSCILPAPVPTLTLPCVPRCQIKGQDGGNLLAVNLAGP